MMKKTDLKKILSDPELVSELKKMILGEQVEPEQKKRGRPKKDISKTEDKHITQTEDIEIIDLTKGKTNATVKNRQKMCHRVPIVTNKKINTFIDDKKTAIEDYKFFDSKVKRGTKVSRPKPKKYKIQCHKCKQVYVITEDMLPPVYDTGEDASAYYTCDNCIPGR